MAQVERMTLEMDVIAKVDGAIGGINKIKSTLQGIKMPPKLGADLEKSFSNLGGLFEKYKDQVKNGFNTKGDVSAFAKTAKQIDNEVDRLSKNLHKLTGEKITLNIETDRLKAVQKDLTTLIAQKEKLMSDVKGSFGLDNYFKAFKDSSVGRSGTKIRDAANVMQTSLQHGDIAKALEDVKTLEAEYDKMSDKRKAAFKELTGVSGDAAIQQLKTNLQSATQETTKLDNSIKTTTQDLENIPTQMMNDASKQAEKAAQGMDKLATETKQVTASSTEAARATQSMSQQLQDLQHSTQYFFSLRNMINLFKRGVQDAVQSVKELDAAMTDTAVVTDYKVSDLWGMLPEYTKIANDLGATTQGAYETMTLYFQQGLDQQQAFEIGAETMKMARIAGLEYAEATDMMTAALRGFNMELNEASAQRINDVYSKLAAVTASDTEELGTAMQRTASIAHSAGMSFEGTTAFLAQAIETTREPAENLGTAMKTIVARFQEMKKNPLEITEVDGEEVSYNKVDQALQSIGVSLKDTNGQFRELDQVFLDISKRWDGLSQTQQRYIATIAAGSRQQSRFIAMMSNYGRTVELMDAANNSAGASEEQFGKTMDSLEAKLNRLHNAWQQFTMGIANNGMIKLAVDGTTNLLNVVNKLIDKFSLGIGPVKSLLSLLTAFTGLKMAGRFANSLIGGLGGLIDPQSGFLQGFKGGAIGSRTTVNSAQAQAISNPIVQAIHQLQSALTGKLVTNNAQTATNNTNLASGALFKQVNEGIRKALSTDKLTGSGLMSQLGGLDKTSQRLMMANLTGTQRSLNQNLLGQYSDSIFKKSMPAIQTAFKRIDQKVANESIAFTEGYAAKVSPKALLQHLDMNNANEKALGQSIAQQMKYQVQDALTKAVLDRAKVQGRTLEDNALKGEVRAYSRTSEGKDLAKRIIESMNLQDPSIMRTPMQQAMDDLGKFGSGLTGAGMAISTFGNALTATGIPGIQQLGTILSTVGSGIMSLGTMLSGAVMAVAAFTEAAAESAAVQKMVNFIKNPVTIAVAAVAAALIGLAAVIKLHNKKIKEEAEQITTQYNEKTSKAKENINNLKQYREELATLSKGVDENGLNVNLDTADYERYRDIVNSIAEINPNIVQGYNAQGDAIIDNNNALEETLRLQEEINQKANEEYTNPYSLDKLIKARDLDEAFFDPTSKKTGQDSDPARQAAKHLINVFKKSHVQDEFLEQFGLSYDQLAKDENNAISRFIANHDAMMRSLQNRYKATGRELNSSLIEGFGNLSEAYDAQQEAIKPIYDNLLAYASNKQLTKGFEPEMISAFNQGLKTIAGSKANGSQMQQAVDKYAKLMGDLIGKNSEYKKIMQEVADLQEDWADNLDDDTYLTAAQEKADALTELADKEREAAESAEDMTEAEREAHRVMADFYDNSAAKVLGFTNKSIQDLTSTFNEFSESIRNAGKAYEDYQKRIEGLDNYGTGVNSFKQIYDDIFKETEDSAGNKQQLNIEGIGRPEAWEAAKSFFTSDWLSGKSINEVVDGLKQIGPLLEEGQKGAIAFGDKIRDSLLNDKGFKKRFGEVFSLNPDGSVNIAENIAPEMMEHIARYWGLQEDLLVAWFNNARQYMPEFTFSSSNEDIRNALAKDSRTYRGPEEATGDKEALFVRKDTLVEAFEAGGTYAQDVIDTRITELGTEQSVYAIPELDKDFKLSKEDKDYMTNTMGINKNNFVDSLAPLLTGEEMEQYAGQIFENGEQWWKETGEGLYDTWSANQEALIDDLAPQEGDELPSIASSVSNIESMMTTDLYRSGQMEDTSSLDQMHRAIFGNEGWDTSVQKLKHGADLDLTKEQFEQYYSDATAAVSALSKVEEDLNAGRLQAIRDYGESSEQVKRYDEAIQQVQSDLKYAQGAIAEADQYKETKTWQYDDPSIQQHVNDVISAGWGKLLSGIPVETLATPEAQQAMATIASNTFSPDMIPTEELTNALSVLGLEWNQAALSGMEAWNTAETARVVSEKITETGKIVVDGIQTGLQTGVDQKGEELNQTGEEAGSSMLNKIDTSWIFKLANNIVQKYQEAVNNNPIDTSTVTPTVKQGAEVVSNITQGAVAAATLTVDTSDSDAKLEATQEKTNAVVDTINQGAQFIIDVPGIDKLNQAATAANNLNQQSGNQTVGIKTSFDASAVKSGVDTIKGMTPKIQVGADTKKATDAAETARSIIDNKKATIDVSTKVTGQNVDIYITKHVKEAYTGVNNKISYVHVPQAGSLAGGTKKGKIGPRNQGGMTLTGELGYEIAWLPSENRSVILGANGPQMVNLPKDATVYNHEQSKEIMKKRKGISAGSMWGGGTLQTSVSGGYTGSTTSHIGGGTEKIIKDTGKKVTQAAEKAEKAVGRVSVWWENIARKTEITQRKMDSNQKAFEKYITDMQATLRKTGTIGKGNAYIANLGKYIGYNEAQVNKANKELKGLNNTKKGLTGKDAKETQKNRRKKYGKAGYENIVQISYEIKNSKGKKETVNRFADLSGYIKWDKASGTYVVDQTALNKIKNRSQRKATAEAANKELNDRLSKKYKAQDNIEKAREELEKFSKTLYDTFFGWEISLNKIWNITQKIEAAQSKISRTDAMTDLIESQVNSGKRSGRGGADQSLTFFQQRLKEQEDIIAKRKQAITENTRAVTRALTTADEKKQLDEIQKKLKDDKNAQKTIKNEQKKIDTANANIKKYQKEKKKIQKDKNDLIQRRKALQAAKKKAKTKKARDAIQRDIDKINDRIAAKDRALERRDTWIKNNRTARTTAQTAIAEAKKSVLNDTQRAGYEAYEKELNNRRQAIFKAKKFGTIKRNADGTVEINFDSKLLEQERLNGNIDEELAKFIEEYYTTLEEASKNLDESIENTITDVNEYYNTLAELKDQWADYESQLVQITEESNKKQLENLQKLSDSVKKALDDLFNDVKTRLDNRRKQEDNAKTESDISKKQQRLAALRADTTGGHQVEIAQLESEIAEAQQDYRRSLEDQLLEKLQQQGDEAAKQRERQIALQEQLLTTANNIALVDAWMANPAAYEDELRKAYRDANDYENKGIWGQEKIDRDFESFYLGLLTNQDKQVELNKSIGELTATLNDLMDLQKKSGKTIAELGQENASISTMHDEYGFNYTAIKNEGYDAQDFADDNISYEDARTAFSAQELSEVDAYKADANKEIKQDAYTKKLNALKKQKKLSYKDITALQSVANDAGYHARTFLPALVGGKNDNITWAMVLQALKGHWSKYRLALTFSSDGFKKAYDKVYGKGKYKENRAYAKNNPKKYSVYKYRTGGLATQAGPAWLDGTPSKPELVLNAQDTKNFIALKDVLDKAMHSTNEINNSYGGDATYEINISVDKIANDYDVDKMAERIKKIIVKDSSYRNVTQVRNFR